MKQALLFALAAVAACLLVLTDTQDAEAQQRGRRGNQSTTTVNAPGVLVQVTERQQRGLFRPRQSTQVNVNVAANPGAAVFFREQRRHAHGARNQVFFSSGFGVHPSAFRSQRAFFSGGVYDPFAIRQFRGAACH